METLSPSTLDLIWVEATALPAQPAAVKASSMNETAAIIFTILTSLPPLFYPFHNLTVPEDDDFIGVGGDFRVMGDHNDSVALTVELVE
jgi:hypothetical protein